MDQQPFSFMVLDLPSTELLPICVLNHCTLPVRANHDGFAIAIVELRASQWTMLNNMLTGRVLDYLLDLTLHPGQVAAKALGMITDQMLGDVLRLDRENPYLVGLGRLRRFRQSGIMIAPSEVVLPFEGRPLSWYRRLACTCRRTACTTKRKAVTAHGNPLLFLS